MSDKDLSSSSILLVMLVSFTHSEALHCEVPASSLYNALWLATEYEAHIFRYYSHLLFLSLAFDGTSIFIPSWLLAVLSLLEDSFTGYRIAFFLYLKG